MEISVLIFWWSDFYKILHMTQQQWIMTMNDIAPVRSLNEFVPLLQALTMSNEARKNVTVGEIVNLMSVDAQRVQDVAGYVWMMWSSPLQIAISVYMLWGIVGPSVLTGLAVMILLIPVNGVMATFQRKLQVGYCDDFMVDSWYFVMTSWYLNNFLIAGPLWGNPPVTGGFPSWRTSNAKLWCF